MRLSGEHRTLWMGIVLAFGLACTGLFPVDDATLVAPAEKLLQSGDLPGAAAEYEKLFAENPESVGAAVGYAYTQLLAGDIRGADTTLAAIEPLAGEQVGEIRFRRALVALEAKDLGRVKMLGQASGLPEGELFAAEVDLVSLQHDAALPVLKKLSSQSGIVGGTAQAYVTLLESGNQHKASLAEASALWALGDHGEACAAVLPSIEALDEGDAEKAPLQLLWAGRAVVSGQVGVAKRLLEDLFPPAGQEWRYQSTLAMIRIAEGNNAEGLEMFEALKQDGKAPADGLADALATACALTKDAELAKKLVEGLESAAAARCLLEAGDPEAASHAPPGPLRTFLEKK